MAKVKLEDILIPDVWDPYFIELSTEKSALIQAGIVTPDANLNELAQAGGNIITMPFYTDLTGDDQILDDSTPLTTGKIGTAADAARLHLRGDARSVNDLSGALSGTDPLKIIANLIHNYWERKEQALLLSSLAGVFADNLANDGGDLIWTAGAEAVGDVVEWNGTGPTVMNPIAIIDGQALLGDAQDIFTAIAMHSKCFTDLIKQDLIDYERPSEGATKLPYYLDKQVIIDDSCPTRVGSTSGTLYQSFLFAQGAVGRGEGQAPIPSEFDRQALASDTNFITRRHYLLHPRGIKWLNVTCTGATPTNAECELADNWDRVYDKKHIRVAMIETN